MAVSIGGREVKTDRGKGFLGSQGVLLGGWETLIFFFFFGRGYGSLAGRQLAQIEAARGENAFPSPPFYVQRREDTNAYLNYGVE